MPIYVYNAKNLKGEALNGEHECVSLDALEYMLRSKGYFLVESRVKGKEYTFSGLVSRINAKDIAVFCRQFAVIINSGITLLEAVAILRDQSPKKRQKKVLEEVYTELQKGRVFSEAIKPYVDMFPEFLQNMIRVGEASGALDTILNRLAEYYENDHKVRRKVKSAMTYPVILGVLTIGVVIMLMVAVLPMFSNILEGMGGELPAVTKVLMALSSFMAKNILIIIALIILIVVFGSYLLRTENGRLWYDGIKLKLPVVSKVVLKTIAARFARSMSILLKSGIPIINAMEIMCDLIGNREVERQFSRVKDEIEEGKGIAGPLRRLDIFPPLLVHMITVGESTGELDEMLGRTAGFFDEEVEEAVEKTVALVEPVMIIFMAGIIGTIIISIMLPMVSLMNTVN